MDEEIRQDRIIYRKNKIKTAIKLKSKNLLVKFEYFKFIKKIIENSK